jgi:glycosyltransferase involved in cell wall biosynthesis
MCFKRKKKKHNPPQISFLVPFRPQHSQKRRQEVWQWLQEYWRWELPGVEIVTGHSKGKVFSKSEAVNDAAKRASGRIFVIIDADCYIDGDVIRACADRIDRELRRGNKLWYVPYRSLYRLTKESTDLVLDSDPRHPYTFSSPPCWDEVESTEGSGHGHRFGAMIQIMPREAFFAVGGMDPRFRGWGGEDVAFVKALDTLYSPHKTTNNDVLHMWHPKIGDSFKTRMWEGQHNPGLNGRLASRYMQSVGDRVMMRKVVDEGFVKQRGGFRAWFRKKKHGC